MDLTKISLAEFLRYYEQPISEEQAWAICFQSCCKMKQIVMQGVDSVLHMIILDVDNLYIHSDGSVSFTLGHNFDNQINQQPSDSLEDKLTEFLGKLIYKALDWGIESHMERELSESLEKLISFMLKLNPETTKAAVTFQDVIKICENRFLKPSEAASHYTMVCKVLFAEYVELHKLTVTIRSCKEVCWKSAQAGLWQRVLGDLQKGVRLRKAMEQPRIPPEKGAHTSYSKVVDDIRNKRYTLNKVSARKLKERPFQEPSLHDQLMTEVKNPPKLRSTFIEKSRNKYKENFQKLSLNSLCGGIFCDQTVNSVDFLKAKKPRLNYVQSDQELKMTMPVRPCVRLPLDSFEVVQLDKEDDLALLDQKATQLVYEIDHWDSSKSPLVLEPQCLSPPLASRTKSMMDWPSMEICTKCEQRLLEILSHQPP
ncbi:hypothetical protein EYD10_03439 [Varanus komodoensis]|nr:hypothetical protein EYD10_03439 [Varanus komodoensis]